jgi:hypothetical protein
MGIKKATPEEQAKLNVKGQIIDAVDQVTKTDEEGDNLEKQLKGIKSSQSSVAARLTSMSSVAERQLTVARDAQAKADALVRAGGNVDWPLTSSSLNNVKTLTGTVASKQLVISSALKMVCLP